MKTKTILISGASVAGPALAFWLNRYGFQTTIIERAPGIRPGGYAVDFRGAAMEVLVKMGLLDEIRKYETRTGTITIVDKNNKKVASMPEGFTSGELEIMRGDLVNVFYDATKQDVEYIFDDSIISLVQNMDGVEVTFEHHPARHFDLVIGADGLHSNVRKIAFGDEAKFCHDFGLYIAIFTTPNFMNVGMNGLFYSTPGKRVGFFGARQSTEARASFYFASEPLQYDRRDIAQQQQILRYRFTHEQWQVPQLLELMDSAPDFYFDAISQIKMDRWSTGRIALIGDAAHCASPLSGMGTSMAVVGAYILAGELKKANGDYAVAFSRYEDMMRPFVKEGQKLADGGADWFVPTTRLKHWFSQQMWKVLPYSPWKNMMIELPSKIARSVKPENY
ncbi:2-polyprenyl-6-methoxyphenol hydroxylase-like FAD-dependent oxidoreductase [Chitinophaga niastensis]|uniref:2-polyprenyl-6-methoxyphenol hydroxylase-like FAD-dependent oxidoreductase n=1 Tax=Chitinophaga niastensis TaxID=536980 RepID=A0A2P8HVV4_CHINA|nr:FAD-dependent monooxygenase [Chitinophaga niastensis]PSL50350.1 2-polyprenyl-6-methoxyphenol hydroxylase-like FAD-dependent oxidoreductase [Chitinophaga niastensis]